MRTSWWITGGLVGGFKTVVYGYTDVLYIATEVFVKGHRTEEIQSYCTSLKLLEGPVKELFGEAEVQIQGCKQ